MKRKKFATLALCIALCVSLVSCLTQGDIDVTTDQQSIPTPTTTVSMMPQPTAESVPTPTATATTAPEATVPQASTLPEDSTFEVHYIDVGQADSALILCDNSAMLIDGGNVADSDLVYAYLKYEGVDSLDYVVCTHAHEDHVGGLAGALNYATANVALAPVNNYDTKAFSSFVKYLEDTKITVPKPGDTYTLGSSSFEIYGPTNAANDPNNTSIVLKLTYGDTSFLFTGDAEREEEQDILDTGYDLNATVLKVGHHGSDTSTTYPFLREIMPQYAVISVGQGNTYGHPTEATLSRLRDADVTTYRTDMQGTVICTSDGKNVSFSVERNADVDTLELSTADGHYGQPAVSTNTPEPSPEPIPTPEPEPTQSQKVETTVYVTNTGEKYHSNGCQYLRKSQIEISLDSAKSQGYTPCSRCHPPR